MLPRISWDTDARQGLDRLFLGIFVLSSNISLPHPAV